MSKEKARKTNNSIPSTRALSWLGTAEKQCWVEAARVRHTPLSLILNHQLGAGFQHWHSTNVRGFQASSHRRPSGYGRIWGRSACDISAESQPAAVQEVFDKPRHRLISIVVPSASGARRDATSGNPASLVQSEKYVTCAASNHSSLAKGETPAYLMIVHIDAAVSLHRRANTPLQRTVHSQAM